MYVTSARASCQASTSELNPQSFLLFRFILSNPMAVSSHSGAGSPQCGIFLPHLRAGTTGVDYQMAERVGASSQDKHGDSDPSTYIKSCEAVSTPGTQH